MPYVKNRFNLTELAGAFGDLATSAVQLILIDTDQNCFHASEHTWMSAKYRCERNNWLARTAVGALDS